MSREAEATKILALLATLNVPTQTFVTISDTLRHWDDVPPAERPAIFLAKGNETAERQTRFPTKWHRDYWLWIYVSKTDDRSPQAILNPLLDQVEAAFADPFPGVPQTLDKLVEYCRIDGTIETFEGVLQDQEVCRIPLKLLTL